MKKMVFKNEILNVVLGSILVILPIVGYFTKVIEDYLPIFVAAVIVLLSLKRFIYIFNKTVSKNASLVLIVEFLLDIIFAGLLIYLKDHIELFLGLVFYVRGVSYLIINYIASRKVDFTQYLLNIVYVTFGAFLIFTTLDLINFLEILISVIVLAFGGIFLYYGIKKLMAKNKKKTVKKIDSKKDDVKEKEMKNIEKKETKMIDKTRDEETEKIHEKKIEKTEDKKVVQKEKIDYNSKTMIELKEIAKKRNITGVSSLNKADLIAKLKE